MHKLTRFIFKKAKSRLFWKIGLAYLLMILIVLVVLDTYVVQTLKHEYLEAAFSQLESLSHVALRKPPQSLDTSELAEWSRWLAQSG